MASVFIPTRKAHTQFTILFFSLFQNECVFLILQTAFFYISRFCPAANTIPDMNNLKEDILTLAHGFRGINFSLYTNISTLKILYG